MTVHVLPDGQTATRVATEALIARPAGVGSADGDAASYRDMTG
ncbi:hypothetical protein [Mycobacterium botniense]|nr:hypothetical protein [Mycobacterium botniense]